MAGDSGGFGPGFVIGALAIGALALCIGSCCSDDWKDECVRQGAAEYYIDEHFQKQWRWKNRPEAPVKAEATK